MVDILVGSGSIEFGDSIFFYVPLSRHHGLHHLRDKSELIAILPIFPAMLI